MRPATSPLAMTKAQREILEHLAKSRTAAHRDVTRAKALLPAEHRVHHRKARDALGLHAELVRVDDHLVALHGGRCGRYVPQSATVESRGGGSTAKMEARR
jgi:hypothetical protein